MMQSKRALFPFFLTALLACAPAKADGTNPDLGTGATPEPIVTGKAQRVRGKVKKSAPGKPSGTIIHGRCTVIEGPSNPLAGPCVDTLLILKDGQGAEIMRARTSTQGIFDFAVENPGKFSIASGSNFYEVIPSGKPIRPGEGVDLKVRQK